MVGYCGILSRETPVPHSPKIPLCCPCGRSLRLFCCQGWCQACYGRDVAGLNRTHLYRVGRRSLTGCPSPDRGNPAAARIALQLLALSWSQGDWLCSSHPAPSGEKRRLIGGRGVPRPYGWLESVTSLISKATRMADSREPSTQACLSEVCSPAKWIGPSGVGMCGWRFVSWPALKTAASPKA